MKRLSCVRSALEADLMELDKTNHTPHLINQNLVQIHHDLRLRFPPPPRTPSRLYCVVLNIHVFQQRRLPLNPPMVT